MNNKTNLHCPHCQNLGKSVAAICMSGSSQSETSGEFTGGGAGISLSGSLGIGMGGGSYTSETKQNTRLAELFQPPEKPVEPEEGLYIPSGIWSVLALLPLILLARVTNAMGGNDNCFIKPIGDFVGIIDSYSGIIFFVGLILAVSCWAIFPTPEHILNERENAKKVYATKLKYYEKAYSRYKQLKYCDTCHLIFDTAGNSYDADGKGIQDALMDTN